MRMELEGKEPLILLFGVPVATAVIVLTSMYVGWRQGIQTDQVRHQPPPIHIKAQMEVPKGGIKVDNHIPPLKLDALKGALSQKPQTIEPKINLNPTIKADLVLPKGSIQITNKIDGSIIKEPKADLAQLPPIKEDTQPEKVAVKKPDQKNKPKVKENTKNKAPEIRDSDAKLKKVAKTKTPKDTGKKHEPKTNLKNQPPNSKTTPNDKNQVAEKPNQPKNPDKDNEENLLPPPRDVVNQN